MGCATSHRQLACACTRRRNRRAPTSHGRREIPLHYCLQPIEKYDSDSSTVCSEEEVGDEDDEENGSWLVSTHYARAAADVPRTDVLSALMLHVRPPFLCLSFTDGARQLLGFGLGPIQGFDAWFAVVHLSGVYVSLHDGWYALLSGTLPVLPSAGRSQLVVVVVVRIVCN